LRKFITFFVLLNSCVYFSQVEKKPRKISKLSPEIILQELIKFESISGQEKDIIFYLEKFAKDNGLYTDIFSKDNQIFNLTASLYPLNLNKPNIIFLSHLDVVPANDVENWKNNPFKGQIIKDTVHGRGSIDCKGLAVMQLFSIIDFVSLSKTQDLPYNITFLGVSEEESGGELGAKFMVQNYLKALNPVVVFGEGGSGMNNLVPSYPNQEVFGISVAEKSSLWLKLDVNKKGSGHSAVPYDLYANKRLIKSLINLLDQKREVKFSKLSRQMFKDLGKMEGGFRGFVIKHINWIVFWPFVKKYFREGEIFNVLVNNTFVITDMGTLNSDAVNQIGKGAYAILDCRLLPGTDKKKFIRRVQFAVGLKVDITVISESPNTPASPINDFFHQMKYALNVTYPGSTSSPILFPASTDNNYFRQYKIPTYGIIPCVIDRDALDGIHGVNEYLPVKSLYSGIQTYKTFIHKVQNIE
jgi:acetylornithine deacetylase/succinyl-diaminopimelate desuccinylase-like protein